MAGISQNIPNYGLGGISGQPDQLKRPGQVKDIVNAIPDIIHGLYKRPGAQRVGNDILEDCTQDLKHKWFHYYRDENEGAYVGHIDEDGIIRMWSCNDGSEKTVYYATYDNDGNLIDDQTHSNSNTDHTMIAVTDAAGSEPWAFDTLPPATNAQPSGRKYAYLKTSDPDNLQTMTINDTTFINNKIKEVRIGDETPSNPDKYWTYVEILRTENGRQYALNFHEHNNPGGTEISTVTQLKLIHDDLYEGKGSGHCPGIGTQVFTVNSASSYEGNDEKIPYKTTIHVKERKNNWDADTAWDNTNHNVNASMYTSITDDSRKNLTFRITTTGQQGRSPEGTSDDNTPDDSEYECSYNRNIVLLHGGEGWKVGDMVRVQLTNKLGGREENDGGSEGYGKPGRYILEVQKVETAKNISAGIKAVRPAPTPFDADTAVSVDSVIGGILDTIGYGSNAGETALVTDSGGAAQKIKYQIIGNGIYFYSEKRFIIDVNDKSLMNTISYNVSSVSDLPLHMKDGVIVKVENSEKADEDNYYLKFRANRRSSEDSNALDGTGVWQECVAPTIKYHDSIHKDNVHRKFTYVTMPHVLQRKSDGHFIIKKYQYATREVGDHLTNPFPSFCSTEGNGGFGSMRDWYGDTEDSNYPKYYQNNTPRYITKVLFFRNRLVFFSGENIVCSRPGTLSEPNFWSNTALTVSAIDPIDIALANTQPGDLVTGIELPAGLLCFTDNGQFLLADDDGAFTTEQAKLKQVSNYNYNRKVEPILLGTTLGFLDDSNKYTRFNELSEVRTSESPQVQDVTQLVPNLIPLGQDLLMNSKESDLVFIGRRKRGDGDNAHTGSDTLYGCKYFKQGLEQKVVSWFKWKFKNKLRYAFIANEVLYFVDENKFLQKINLTQASTDLSIDQDGVNYPLHLDNWIPVADGNTDGGNWDPSTNLTTFQSVTGQSKITNYSEDLAIVDSTGRYGKCTTTSTNSFTVPGNWSTGTRYIGYLYEYQVDFPTIYPIKNVGESVRSDTSGSLTLHRLNLNFGKVGTYETTLQRLGKPNYVDTLESATADSYDSNDAPYLEEEIRTIPIYEKTDNIKVTLKSKHPSPATLHSVSWEGDFSTRNYKRV